MTTHDSKINFVCKTETVNRHNGKKFEKKKIRKILLKMFKLMCEMKIKIEFQATTEPLCDDTEVDEQEFYLNHVILPRYIPAEKQGYTNQIKLMNVMLQTVFQLGDSIPAKTTDFLKQFHRLHVASLDTFQSILKEQIKTLLTGETFAMFVRRQNCTLMIHKHRNDDIVLATFRGDFKSSEVYRYDSDIEVSVFFT